MAFGIDMWSVTYIPNWERADKEFNSIKQPRGKAWRADERPLRDNRAHHLRMVRRADESYDLMLYRHTLLRYFKPEGERRVVEVFMPWTGRGNFNFIHRMGWGFGSTHAALRHEHPVWLHPYPSNEHEHLAAHLVLKGDKIDTTQSWQLQSYRWHYFDNNANKEKQAVMRERLCGLVLTLQLLQDSHEPEFDRMYDPLRTYRYKAPKNAFSLAGLSQLRSYAYGYTDNVASETVEQMVEWFKLTRNVRHTTSPKRDAEKLTDRQIEDYLLKLMPIEATLRERVKVPVRMWRSGGNRPSPRQYFRSRADMQKEQELLEGYNRNLSEGAVSAVDSQ